MDIKTTTGIIKLIRDGVVMAERKYFYDCEKTGKDEVLKALKHKYGKIFYTCEVHIQNVPIIEKVYERPPMYRDRLRKKVPEYVLSNLPNFHLEELKKLKELVEIEISKRPEAPIYDFKPYRGKKLPFAYHQLKKVK